MAATYSGIKHASLNTSVAYALWLGLGTTVAAIIVFRRDIVEVVNEAISIPRSPSPLLRFLFIATVVSALVGVPLLLAIKDLNHVAGGAVMAIVGLLMLITGSIQLRRGVLGTRTQDDVNSRDGLLTGVAQGLAALPGLSRSGLTVAMLLSRRIDRREALALSFLMSIPASLGAALYGGYESGFGFTVEGLVGAAVAAVVGLITIRLLLNFAERVNFGWMVIIVAVAILGGAVWQFVVTTGS